MYIHAYIYVLETVTVVPKLGTIKYVDGTYFGQVGGLTGSGRSCELPCARRLGVNVETTGSARVGCC